MEALYSDVRQALRALRRSPGFSAAAIGILALGLAANTAVFSVADAVLFRPLGYNRPSQLVAIAETIPRWSHIYPRIPVNAAHYYEWRARCRSFADLAILDGGNMNLTSDDGPPERLGMALVSANLLPLLGVSPSLGRFFSAEEDRPGNERVVILTDGLWRRRFHGDPSVLNKTIMLSGTPHIVAGVLPSGFRFPRLSALSMEKSSMSVDLFKPIALDRSKLKPTGNFNSIVIGRLRPEVTWQEAHAELNGVQAALTREIPSNLIELRAEVTPLQEQIVAGSSLRTETRQSSLCRQLPPRGSGQVKMPWASIAATAARDKSCQKWSA